MPQRSAARLKAAAAAPLRRLLVGLAVGAAATVGVAVLVLPDTPVLAAAPGRPGVVTTVDGKTLQGDVTENAESVTVSVNGIVTTLPRDAVRGIEYGTPEQRLQTRLDAVPASDLSGRLAIAREGLSANLLDFAQTAAQNVLRDDPGNTAANAVLDDVSRQRRLNQSSGTGVRPPPGNNGNNNGGNGAGAARPAAPEPARPISPPDAGNTLGDEQINLIRQAELQPGDVRSRQPPRIQFRDDVVKRYGESQQNFDFRQFNNLPDVQKALIIFGAGDAQLRKDVRVTSNPPALTEYLRGVEPFVLNGCATSQCHGGGNNAGFALYRNPRDEAASYTNFYVLTSYDVKVPDPAGNAFGGGDVTRRMIDRNAVDDSLLLSYLLPSNLAKYPHPKVENYNGLVANAADQNFQTIRNWIAGLAKTGGPEAYGFEFKMPAATTAPSEGE